MNAAADHSTDGASFAQNAVRHFPDADCLDRDNQFRALGVITYPSHEHQRPTEELASLMSDG